MIVEELANGVLPVTVPRVMVLGECDDPIPVAVPSLTHGSNVGVPSPDPYPVFCGTAYDGGPGQWYLVTGNDNFLTASTCKEDADDDDIDDDPATGDADFDTIITVYCLACDALQCITANDDSPGCTENTSSTTWCSEDTAPYLVFVHGFNAATGNYDLAILDDGPCPRQDVVSCILTQNPPGACCFDNCDILEGVSPAVFDECAEFACEEIPQDECESAGGTFLGPDVPCVAEDDPVAYTSTPAEPIPDNDPTGLRDEIVIPDTGLIADLDVPVLIDHTWIGDLAIFVDHKDTGTQVTLWQRNCGSSSGLDIYYDDEGTQIWCGFPGYPTTGSIPPELPNGFTSALRDFDGEDIQGSWNLKVDDTFAADSGVLQSWSLVFTLGTPNCPQDCGEGPADDEEDEDPEDGNPGTFASAAREANAASDGVLELDAKPTSGTERNGTRGTRGARTR